jgi:hypothetical protein
LQQGGLSIVPTSVACTRLAVAGSHSLLASHRGEGNKKTLLSTHTPLGCQKRQNDREKLQEFNPDQFSLIGVYISTTLSTRLDFRGGV